jgi:hypothetical protein
MGEFENQAAPWDEWAATCNEAGWNLALCPAGQPRQVSVCSVARELRGCPTRAR